MGGRPQQQLEPAMSAEGAASTCCCPGSRRDDVGVSPLRGVPCRWDAVLESEAGDPELGVPI